MDKNKLTIVILSIALIVGGLGCATISSLITPAVIDRNAVGYVESAGIADANEFSGYPNLDKAVKLERKVGDAHEIRQLELIQKIDQDNLSYALLSKTTTSNRTIAQAREEQLFGPDGLLTLGLSMAGFGSLTGLIGLMRKRPGDITPEELKQAISGKDAELSNTEEQLFEIVKGIQKFIELGKDPTNPQLADNIELLKNQLDRIESADTKQTVAQIKATI